MDGNSRPTELQRNENGWKHPSDRIAKKWKWMETSVRPNCKEMKMDGNIRPTELQKNENGWKHPSDRIAKKFLKNENQQLCHVITIYQKASLVRLQLKMNIFWILNAFLKNETSKYFIISFSVVRSKIYCINKWNKTTEHIPSIKKKRKCLSFPRCLVNAFFMNDNMSRSKTLHKTQCSV